MAVPINRTELMNVYYTILNVKGATVKKEPSVKGDVGSTSTTIDGTWFATSPVRTLTLSATPTSTYAFYFVPAFDFVGVYAGSTKVTLPEGFEPDGKSLYVYNVSGIAKVSL